MCTYAAGKGHESRGLIACQPPAISIDDPDKREVVMQGIPFRFASLLQILFADVEDCLVLVEFFFLV